MKNMFISAVTLVVLLLLLSCTAVTRPSFADSNQVLIEDTVKKLSLGQKIKSLISTQSSVVLTSIEKDITLDTQIIVTIEDNIIESLLEEGFNVLERDINSLSHFKRENARKEENVK